MAGLVRTLVAIVFAATLVVIPLSRGTTTPAVQLFPDRGTAVSTSSSTTVSSTPDGVRLSVHSSLALHVRLRPNESLAQLRDGSIAVVAPWPAELLGPGDGTYYPPSETDHRPAPLPKDDPYAHSADPDGSMAADEAMHDVGPFDPAYADEYKPDLWAEDPADVSLGPPPGRDTSDPIEPSDNEVVPASDSLDAIYAIEASRPDQVVALIAPVGQNAVLRITARDMVEVTLTGVASIGISFNPDADTAG
jgi:hypothetical protein